MALDGFVFFCVLIKCGWMCKLGWCVDGIRCELKVKGIENRVIAATEMRT
jgi:hypothetical protein